MEKIWQDILERERRKATAAGIQVHIVAPSMARIAETFDVRLLAVGADHLPFAGTLHLTLSLSPHWEGLPRTCSLGPEGLRFRGVKLVAPGLHYLSATVREFEHSGPVSSNPVWATDAPKRRLYWGDLHVHSIDGWCQPYAAKASEFGVLYARDVTFLDFVSITDHNDMLDAEKWASQKELVRRYDQPGTFVPILGFESSHATGLGGDNNVYFPSAEGDYLPRGPNATDTPLERLWEFLEGRGVPFMTVPHHTGRLQKYRSWDELRYRPDCERLYEVYSMWGSSDARHGGYPLHGGNTEAPAYFNDALARGARFGAIASSDDHTTMPGSESRLRMPGRSLTGTYAHHGLAGILAEGLTREALWSAMGSRRTLATTYGRPILLFETDGAEAGEETIIGPSARKRRVFRVVHAPAYAERQHYRVSLWRNGVAVAYREARTPSGTDVPSIELVDEAPIDGLLLHGTPYGRGDFIVYYVRIDDPLGGSVWSSPLWLVV